MRLLITIAVCFGVATILSEAALVGVLVSKGLLSRGKAVEMLAVAHGVDLPSIRQELTPIVSDESGEQYSWQQIQDGRRLLNLDLDLREIGADKGWSEIRELRKLLESDRDNYRKLKETFDERLAQLQQAGADAGLRDVQGRLESMKSKQAKEQILRILDDKIIGTDQALDEVVVMVKSMAPERRKKILSEFKSDEDARRLHQILKRIRQGTSDMELIRETRERVDRFLQKPSKTG